MTEPAKKEAAYEDLVNLPEHMTDEIIDGELIATPLLYVSPSSVSILRSSI